MKQPGELNTKKTILWAIDPFARDIAATEELNRSAAWAIHALSLQMRAEVQPVYVLDTVSSELPNQISGGALDQVRETAQEALDVTLSRVKIPGLLPLEVLSQVTSSSRKKVDQLIRFAKHQNVDLIVVSTRARHGIKRWVGGSFAEELILQSEIPLLVVNPNWKRGADFERILFPTDFSDYSKAAFHQIMGLAKELNSRLILFHKVSFDPAPSVEVAFGSYPAYRDVFSKYVDACQTQLHNWTEQARAEGLKANFQLDYTMAGTPEEAILKEAEREPGMIAMAAQSGAVAATLLGSVTRKVVRKASCPVWIVHPHRAARTEAKKIPGEEAA